MASQDKTHNNSLGDAPSNARSDPPAPTFRNRPILLKKRIRSIRDLFLDYILESEEERRRRLQARWTRRKLPRAREAAKQVRDVRGNRQAGVPHATERQYRIRAAFGEYRFNDFTKGMASIGFMLLMFVLPFWAVLKMVSAFREVSGIEIFASIVVMLLTTSTVGIIIACFSTVISIRRISAVVVIFAAIFALISAVANERDLRQGIEEFKTATPLLLGAASAISIFIFMLMLTLISTPIQRYLINPIRLKYVDTMPPIKVSLVVIDSLSRTLSKSGSYLQPRTKKLLIQEALLFRSVLDGHAQRTRIPLQFRRSSLLEIRDQYQRASALIGFVASQIPLVSTRAEYLALVKQVDDAAESLRKGDWSGLPEVIPETTSSRVRNILKHLATPVLLTGTALALPSVPFIDLSSSAETGIKVALFASAVLSLIPADAEAKKQVLGIFPGGSR
ncbi:hypothetical protein [Glycomyces sp. MUSA5-2]|uniref:hypothetical protein n=1 Tax=Glycomyces sp. MUSA5-2 TaxID=2053002 RepID=UPI003009740D